MPTNATSKNLDTPAPDAPRGILAPDNRRHGEHLHPEQQGYLLELAAVAAEDPANVEKLAAVVQEICRMIKHDDIASISKGLPR